MRKILLLVLASLALGSTIALAQQQQVSVSVDKTYDFTRVKTFAASVATSWGNPIGEKSVLAEIEQALIAKGWSNAEPAKADAMVMVHGATETKKQLNAMYSGGGWRFGGMGTGTIQEQDYTVGTLIVDIFDAHSKELLYRGTAKDQLANTPEKNMKKLEKITTKLFKDFPPAPAKK